MEFFSIKYSKWSCTSLKCHCCFWIAGGLVVHVLYTTHPPAIKKNGIDNSRESQIEPPLLKCEWAFRKQALNFCPWLSSKLLFLIIIKLNLFKYAKQVLLCVGVMYSGE
jgi:hypothetical protein